MATFFVALIVVIMLGLGFFLLRKFPNLKEALPWFLWAGEIVQITVDYWGFREKYKASSKLAVKTFVLAASVSAGKKNLRDIRKTVTAMVDEGCRLYSPDRPLTGVERQLITAAYVTVISHEDIMETMASVWESHEDLEVRRATLLAIDVLGELVDLKDKLGRQYFQHLIYGINKSLKLIRDNGTNKRNLKKVVSTLFRVYKLSKAYRHRRKYQGTTEGEFYDKVITMFERMVVVVATK